MERQNFISRILAVVILLITTTTCTLGAPQLGGGPGPQDQLMETMQRLAQKNTLNYKDRCTYQDERRRTLIGEKFLNMIFEMNFSQMQSLAAEMNQLAQTSRSFCNAAKMLQCTTSGTCDCVVGDLMGMNVRSIREEDACRLAAGSACAPPEALQTAGTDKPDLRCQANSECIMKNSNKLPCTQERMQEKLVDGFGGVHRAKSDPRGFLLHSKKMTSEGICVCSVPAPVPVPASDPAPAPDSSNSESRSRFMSPPVAWVFLLIVAAKSSMDF
jgi:hypothetical protein